MQRGRQRRRTRHAQPQTGELGHALATRPGGRTWSAPRRTGWRRWSRAASSTASASNRGSSTADPPHRSVPWSPTPRPCTWNRGSASTRRSAAVQRHASRSASQLASSVAVGEHAHPWGRRWCPTCSRATPRRRGRSRRARADRPRAGRRRVWSRRTPRSGSPRTGRLRSASTTHAAGAQSPTMCSISRARYAPFTGTTTRPSPQRGHVRDHQLDGRGRAHHDPVARPQPCARQPARDLPRPRVELGVGEPAAVIVHRGRAGGRGPVRHPRSREAALRQEIDGTGVDARRQVARPGRIRATSHAASHGAEATGDAGCGP